MGLTDCYTLEGREIAGAAPEGQYMPAAPCIFCGQVIKHWNDGGPGWTLGAVGPDAMPHWYLYCDQPPCSARLQAEVMNETEVQPYVEGVPCDEGHMIIFRCGCCSDYVESVGDVCHECKADRHHLTPWDR